MLQETGKAIDLNFPFKKRGGLPYRAPLEGKRVVLLDMVVQTSVRDFWNEMLSSSSKELVDFHAGMGDRDIYLGSWKEQADGTKTRLLKFVKPLKNPLGPKCANNYQTFTLVDMSPSGFTMTARCTSEGVPFATSFENHLQWTVSQEDADHTRVIITGECNFTSPVFGPLKGTISRESVKGMQAAYQTLHNVLNKKYGEEETIEEPSDPLDALSKSTFVSGLANSAQTNPAMLVVILASFVIMWRMVMMNTIYTQLLRRLAQQALMSQAS